MNNIQTIASKHLAILLKYCYQRIPNPVQKIFKNLHSSLCNNKEQTPKIVKMLNTISCNQKEFYEYNRFYGILSIKQMIVEELSVPQTPTTPSINLSNNYSLSFY